MRGHSESFSGKKGISEIYIRANTVENIKCGNFSCIDSHNIFIGAVALLRLQ